LLLDIDDVRLEEALLTPACDLWCAVFTSRGVEEEGAFWARQAVLDGSRSKVLVVLQSGYGSKLVVEAE
jgi:hypothetical protein